MFWRMAPLYMTYGMSVKEYWHGNPWLVRSYKEAYDLKRKEQNQVLWLQGLYIYDAFSVVLSNAFAEKGSTPKKYATEPYNIFPMTEEERQAEEEKQLKKVVAQLNAWEKAFNATK
jgi:hypothetical protein